MIGGSDPGGRGRRLGLESLGLPQEDKVGLEERLMQAGKGQSVARHLYSTALTLGTVCCKANVLSVAGLPFPFPGDLPNPAIESVPSALPGGFFTAEPPEKPTGDCREREGGNKII